LRGDVWPSLYTFEIETLVQVSEGVIETVSIPNYMDLGNRQFFSEATDSQRKTSDESSFENGSVKTREVWAEYTNQVVLVTDGFADCSHASLRIDG
jgi:hypothetical protein